MKSLSILVLICVLTACASCWSPQTGSAAELETQDALLRPQTDRQACRAVEFRW